MSRASGYARVDSDWYVEPAWVVDALLEKEQFTGTIWDPACGSGNIVRRCWGADLQAVGTDISDRGFGVGVVDFLKMDSFRGVEHIICNPPYGILQEWIDHALALVPGKVCVLARLAFLEGQGRKGWFENGCLARVWTSSRRVSMPPGGTDIVPKGGSVAYAWFVFERGHTGPYAGGWL